MTDRSRAAARQQLTTQQIINAFPDQCKTWAPRERRRLAAIVREWEQNVKNLRNRHYEPFTERFLLLLWDQAKPIQEIRQIARLDLIIEAISRPEGPSQPDSRITDQDIQLARERPIVELYAFERPRKAGGRVTALCPFHQEKTPSFVIYANNTFHCFGCAISGDPITFVQKMNNLSFPAAVRYLTR